MIISGHVGALAGGGVMVTVAAGADRADVHFTHAAQLAQQGKLESAEAEYQAGLKLRPGDPQAFNNLGVLYFQQRKLQPAIDAFDRAHRLDVRNSEIDFNLGLALSQTDERAASHRLSYGSLARRI